MSMGIEVWLSICAYVPLVKVNISPEHLVPGHRLIFLAPLPDDLNLMFWCHIRCWLWKVDHALPKRAVILGGFCLPASQMHFVIKCLLNLPLIVNDNVCPHRHISRQKVLWRDLSAGMADSMKGA